ncbi:MAG: porin [Hydrogenophaga sp.]|uniref:porin n=1 Tax=Hydrogenophaga sp. TaxID=1904254 RepID=UPI00169C32B3|nr:porin [Hydrogenophaga sp.]NIM42751.1 porin [Hydrogenophaga sp.]NIN25794.1 porin [Hydrogenophaga sp.]NIN30456.1 porin [Hydrogenophaga sp.]NIN56796.1 porin [Hydrogenophaga sp.]NIO53371.1 porin [Hydrogenophaga sp.]
MKKHLLTLACLSTVGAVQAQSYVMLYGVADAALERVRGAATTTRLASGQQSDSRLGMRGVEDLGGGLNAQFLIEGGIDLDAGGFNQGGRAFGRQSFVGLGGAWGTVRLGRQYTAMDDIANIVGTKPYDVLSVVPVIGNGEFKRADNAMTYLSPSFNGLSFQWQHSLGAERARTDASPGLQRQASAHALYTSGALTLGLGLQRVADADGALAGDQRVHAVLLAGSYAFDAIKLTAYVDVEDKGRGKMKVYGLAGARRFGANTVSVGVARARDVGGLGARHDDATLFTLQGSHTLSHRTSLYAHHTRVRNGAHAALGFNNPVPCCASSGTQVGIRHQF